MPRIAIALRWLGALFIAAFVAAINFGIWSWIHQPTNPPDWDGEIGGFAFSAYQRDQSPLRQEYPTAEQIDSDLSLLSRYTGRVRSYASLYSDAIPESAARYGLEVTAGAWLDARRDNNRLELDALYSAASRYHNIRRAIIGNETLILGRMSIEELIPYLDEARRKLDIPISTAEPPYVWLKNPELADHVDFITVHLLPYWEGVPRRFAIDDVIGKYEMIAQAFPKKRIVIGEIGWPSNGDRQQNALASLEGAARFMREFLLEAEKRGYDYYVMEAFDQPWKESDEGRAGAYWGMFDAERQPKFPLTGPVEEDPSWMSKAIVASAVAFLPMLWVMWRMRRLRLWGRLLFAGLMQAGIGITVWSFTLPFEFYLDTLDWIALVLLVPAQLAIVAILWINGFEFVEALAQRDWRRRFVPLADLPADPPMVSIHLPCHNEPPEMVIQTLDSLAALDYPHFEVLVIDNNTKNAAVWQPLQAHCERLGARFRFFHLDPWPGFKAGALNFALQQTDPAAAVVAVVDSDYVVRPDWLRALVGYFDRADTGVVQAPQAHRDFSSNAFRSICNWEYEGFFKIGMHHRNERDAIIQHGTMTMIRRTLLDRLKWAEWCICEDAELGLRVMGEGFRTVYVDEPFGRGVTPADFAAYKTQRFRWAFGAMQILRRHLRDLLSGTRYTVGQRYHFLTGWFSWFADALHLVFTLLAIAWTVGMLAAPGWFSLPHQLFMIPVIGFFVVKVLFGLVLYAAMVKCRWRDVFGASLASMALSHAIARGILRGLVAREHPFARTAKKRRLQRPPNALSAVREEIVLLAGLGAGVAGMMLVPGRDQIEGQLWSAILVAQSLPYLAALGCALIARFSREREVPGEPSANAETTGIEAPLPDAADAPAAA
ncbi:glycosyltransferase [Chiayiivirga flava]|uniref:Beta-monoglucosyldiacylglycerol synthase n=1 Tax=Chiayiivirga flava TaxID=659595 RepID=A0A7W8D5B8_9GAMM|nr:glycosyltransferase [Chiayiivirga flava]MBB5208196.1 exo-beta-1,3-glucanase (GH17 family)/cellulose synthase/poly-beta-1,6-N-acetylglucosamine synthase-like glycosyltransferase [Chiayiivirga flava]